MKKILDLYNKKGWFYRSLRTFLQAFLASVSTIVLFSDHAEAKAYLLCALSSALASGISAAMNLKKDY